MPGAYAHLFETAEARAALLSHRGWDPGAREVARTLSVDFGAPLLEHPVSRLLVECNRSLDHPALFSEFGSRLGPAERAVVIDRYWYPHRAAVRQAVATALASGLAVHVGVHTFTPVWRGRVRRTDIGVLYDPSREPEASIARRWKACLARDLREHGLRVHLNRPYRGWTDGLTTALRGEHAPDRYVGIELELSQRLVPVAREIVRRIGATLAEALTTAR